MCVCVSVCVPTSNPLYCCRLQKTWCSVMGIFWSVIHCPVQEVTFWPPSGETRPSTLRSTKRLEPVWTYRDLKKTLVCTCTLVCKLYWWQIHVIDTLGFKNSEWKWRKRWDCRLHRAASSSLLLMTVIAKAKSKFNNKKCFTMKRHQKTNN